MSNNKIIINYIQVEKVIEIHNNIIKLYGGFAGIKDKQQIESILQHIQNNEYYPTLFEKATHLFFGLIQFHCFNDGNKRTAISVLSIFIALHDINIPNIVTKLEDIAVGVANNLISKEELKKYFEIIFNSFGYNETV